MSCCTTCYTFPRLRSLLAKDRDTPFDKDRVMLLRTRKDGKARKSPNAGTGLGRPCDLLRAVLSGR